RVKRSCKHWASPWLARRASSSSCASLVMMGSLLWIFARAARRFTAESGFFCRERRVADAEWKTPQPHHHRPGVGADRIIDGGAEAEQAAIFQRFEAQSRSRRTPAGR